jgi:hypothetical protein
MGNNYITFQYTNWKENPDVEIAAIVCQGGDRIHPTALEITRVYQREVTIGWRKLHNCICDMCTVCCLVAVPMTTGKTPFAIRNNNNNNNGETHNLHPSPNINIIN